MFGFHCDYMYVASHRNITIRDILKDAKARKDARRRQLRLTIQRYMALYICKRRAYVTDNYRNEITQAFDRVNPIAWRERVTVDFPANYGRAFPIFRDALSGRARAFAPADTNA